MSKPLVYVSGPDRLLPNAKEVRAEKKALCEKYGFQLVSLPEQIDEPKSTREEGLALAKACLEAIKQCDIFICDTRDFRAYVEPFGESAMELGFAWGCGKKCYNYMPDARNCCDRYSGEKHQNDKGAWVDENNLSFEPTALNLMLGTDVPVIEGTFEDALKAAHKDIFGEV